MKKLLLSSAILATFALFSACGDDSSSGPEEESSSSIEAEDKSSSSIEEEGKSSSSDKKSSSSEAKKRDSSSSEEATSSSSEAESSSSIAEESSSSSVIASSSGAKQSSSSEEDSSSSEESSSSANGSSSSVADAVCYGEYGAEYTCVTTRYLNQDMLDTNGYGEFVDTDDKKVYKTVEICDEDKSFCQTWMAQNSNYGTSNSYCYGDVPGNCDTYGRLYIWLSAKAACPSGWHLPNRDEWENLFRNVGGIEVAGSKLKSKYGWNGSGNGEDSYGFAVLPAGYRDFKGDFSGFIGAGILAYFWSSTEGHGNNAEFENFDYDYSSAVEGAYNMYSALSVRCIKD